MISFTVYGNPKALQRHRTFIKNGRRINVDPSKADKADFLAQALNHQPEQPITGPIKLTVTFCMPRPKSHYGTGRNADKLKPSAPIQHTKKPDLDNMIKLVKDALNGVFYKDDSQICGIVASKKYSTTPQTIIYIEEIWE